MDKDHYSEMLRSLSALEKEGTLQDKALYLFGHCNATEKLAATLSQKGYAVAGILDNNTAKRGAFCQNIPIIAPEEVLHSKSEETVVLIAARAYEAMTKQLRQLGYHGRIEKMVEYDSFAEYSLSEDTIRRKQERLKRGIALLEDLNQRYRGCYKIFCPFAALGDVYYAMAYLPYFLQKKKTLEYVVCVIGRGCAAVAELFGAVHVESFSQKDMDELIQAVLYTKDQTSFIPHQDRPYVQTVYKALYIKKVPLEMMYRCGVYALPQDTEPCRPVCLKEYEGKAQMPQGHSVILSPYAKSVTNISADYWRQIVSYFREKGFALYTNVTKEENALPDTEPLGIPLNQMQSAAEWAGTFIGLRSGLCDVIQHAACHKIALYPDAYYSDTGWKMEEIYHLSGWENIIVNFPSNFSLNENERKSE